MLGAGSLIDYGFIPYLIVMAAGCVQMRVMGMRCIIAMLAGTLVPLWVLWAFGLIEPCSFSMPEVVSIFAPESHRPALRLVTATVVVMAAGIVAGLLDMLQVYARNARTRAFSDSLPWRHHDHDPVGDRFQSYLFLCTVAQCVHGVFMTLLYSFRQRGSLGAGTVAHIARHRGVCRFIYMENNKRVNVIIESRIPFVDDRLDGIAEVTRLDPECFTPKAVAGADALIVRTRTRIDSALLAGSKVSFVATATIGTDHIDMEWCRERGIAVANAPGV